MSPWPMVPLGDVLTERQEKPADEAIARGQLRIISKIGFNDGVIQLRVHNQTKTDMILIRPGDLVVSGINAAKGAIAIYDKESKEPVAATIHYGAYIPYRDRVDIMYLWRLLRSRAFRELLEQHLPGGIKTELKAKRLLPISVPLPSLDEQRRIVARIEELAAKINTARSLRKGAIGQSEILVVLELSRMRREMLANSQSRNALGCITQVTSGGTPSRNVPTYWGGDIPWVTSGELLDGEIYETREHITQEAVGRSSAKLFPPGTVLIALYGQGQTRGRTGRLMIEATTNQACCAILPTQILEPKFTQYWLRGLYLEMRETSREGAQPNWNGRMIKNIEIAVPPLPEQRRIVAYLDDLQDRMDTLRRYQAQTATEIEALLPSIFDRAFKGEL